MRALKLLFVGAAVGAGGVYWFDPRRGARRRALARDKAIRFAGELVGEADAGVRDLSHRMHGMAHNAAAHLKHDEHVVDDVLVARVRSMLGRISAHPHAVYVRARDGAVELTGPVLQRERADLIRFVAQVHGVRAVIDSLETVTDEQLKTQGAQAFPRFNGPEHHGRLQKPWFKRQAGTPAGRFLMGGGALLALSAVSPYVLLPISIVALAGIAARREAQIRARRNARGRVRWATGNQSLRQHSFAGSAYPGNGSAAKPTGRARQYPSS